jgi:2-methylcitrate dehydratase PrpD
MATVYPIDSTQGATQQASVTHRLAEWVVGVRHEDLPQVGIDRVKERFLDSFGAQLAGMTVPTGQVIARWVLAQQARGDCTLVGTGDKTSASLAALANATSGHALELCDIATFSGHPANPLTAAVLAVAEKTGASGRDAILAWMIGWEVTGQTTRICASPSGNRLMDAGWSNQGFQPALGAACAAAKLMGLTVEQTRMAIGNAAAGMGGLMKNRASDSKPFTCGNAAMHGVMAAELVALGFTANPDILDGEGGVIGIIGAEGVDPERVLMGLGGWDIAVKGSTIRTIASCAAGHWAVDALLKIQRAHSFRPDDIEAIDVSVNAFLIPSKPYHDPQTGMEAKFSIEYDIAAQALHGRAGLHQFSDALVQAPETRDMLKRITLHPIDGSLGQVKLEGRTVVKLKDGQVLEASSNANHGRPEDPLSRAELYEKFHELSEAIVPREQRDRIIALCERLDEVADMREVAAALALAS